MTPRERGFLLLTQQLGDSDRKPLTVPQFRTLAQRAQQMEHPRQERTLEIGDLTAIGYDFLTAEHILSLLTQEDLLDRYLERATQKDCFPVSRLSPNYPQVLRHRLGLDSPGCLWAKGNLSFLESPMISLVGSRDLLPANYAFAQEVGKQAALQGFILVSGNARGADLAAQDSCLAHGGKVISIVADQLEKCPLQKNVLYLSEDGFDLPFSAQRALSRNRVIHCLPQCVFVAQVRAHKGGTWSGTERNLKAGWSSVFCFADGSPAVAELVQLGAEAVGVQDLAELKKLTVRRNLFDQ